MIDLMDFFGAQSELDYSLWMLKDISEKPECIGCENGFSDKFSPQIYVAAKSIVKCKRQLKVNVKKSDKELVDISLKRLQKYIVTLSQDEQIKVLKYVND